MASKDLAISECWFQAAIPEGDVVVTTYSYVIWLQIVAMNLFQNNEIAVIPRSFLACYSS